MAETAKRLTGAGLDELDDDPRERIYAATDLFRTAAADLVVELRKAGQDVTALVIQTNVDDMTGFLPAEYLTGAAGQGGVSPAEVSS